MSTALTYPTICKNGIIVDSSLNAKSFVVLIVFAIQVWFTVHPPSVNIPNCFYPKFGTSNKFIIRFDMALGSVLCILFLLITTCIGGHEIVAGIVGDEIIQPYSIILIFFSLAYTCVSLDETGLFKWISNWCAMKSGNSALLLFVTFYGLSSVLTLFTSNDIVILTVTPIILYYTRLKNLNPVPYLMAQFIAANTWSVALLVGNPTNIIVATAENLDFIEYIKYLGLPAVGAGIVSFIVLYFMFRNELTIVPTNSQEPIRPETTDILIKSSRSAIIGSVIFILGLVFLVVLSFTRSSLWIPTLVTCLLMLLKDISMDLYPHFWYQKREHEAIHMEEYSGVQKSSSTENLHGMTSGHSSRPKRASLEYTISIGKKMPWNIVPCVFEMFILVESMNSTGWVPMLATGFKSLALSGEIPTSLILTYLFSIMCALVNNQPMTILLTRVLFHPNFRCYVMDNARKASLFALIMGSNYGANLSLNGALAGIMWESILHAKSAPPIGYWYFTKKGSIVMLPSIFVAALISGGMLVATTK